MRHRRGELDGSLALAAAPKLAHDDIGRRTGLQRFKRPGVRFHRTLQTVLVTEFREMTEIIIGEQIGNRAADVPEKTFADSRAGHHAAGESRQIFHEVIAAALLKFRPEISRPVLATDLVAVDQRIVERAAGERPDVIQHLLHETGPMRIQCRFAQLVAFKPQAFRGRGMVIHPDRRVAHPQNRPLARRCLPVQVAIRRHFVGEIHHILKRHRPGRRDISVGS